MCLIVFAYQYHPRYPLILAANRDEFYERPTSKASFWEDHPDVLAGRDMKYGGTWMGITRAGRFAAITNFRDMTEFREHPLSRGLMVKEFLTNHQSPENHIKSIIARQDEYNGFNLVVGDMQGLYCYSNRDLGWHNLTAGMYGLSNHLLDTPWPKVVKGKQSFKKILSSRSGPTPEAIFHMLSDRSLPETESLPDTGVGIEWERILSPVFITSPTYGTRSSTILYISTRNQVTFIEKTIESPSDEKSIVTYEFSIEDH